MPQSPKQRLSLAQEGLFREETEQGASGRELLQGLAREALAVLPALQQPSVGRKREWLQRATAEQEHSWMTHTPW